MKTIFTSLSILFFSIAYAQTSNKAGTLDSSFGENGKILTSSSTSYLDCNAAVGGDNDSIIIAGSINSADTFGFLAMKYSKDGVLDSHFGYNGIGYIMAAGEGQAAAVQSDNKIIIAGYYSDIFGLYYLTVARLNANGTVDSTFGTNGLVKTRAGDRATDIAIQPDGKILVIGVHGDYSLVLCYLPDGIPDENFGINGAVQTKFSNGSNIGTSIMVQPDGKIVVAGAADDEIFLGRYDSDGSLDETFGNNGKVVNDISSGVDNIFDIALQSDGKIVAVGSSTIRSTADTINTFVLRYLQNGTLDMDFGNSGISTYKLEGNAYLNSVKLQTDGKIVVGGQADDITGTTGHFLVERYNTDGSVDSTFADKGYQITEMDRSDLANAVLIQQSGKIVLAGGATTDASGPSELEVALTRYNGDATQKQIIIAKIRHWIQHHNGIEWDNINGVGSYVVQRSYDGIHFNSIARINAGSQSNFTYADPMPFSGNNYYRLQTTSVNGAVNYSNIIAVTNSDIKISPNPAINSLHVEGLSSTQKTKLTIVDIAGNIKLQTIVYASSYNLNIASLKTGNYLLKIEANDNVVAKKFVKE